MNKIKYFILVLLTFAMALDAQAANKCAKIFEVVKLSTRDLTNIEKSITELSQLKLDLDLKQARGARSIEYTALSADFKKKQAQLVQILEAQGFMNRAELFERMKLKIAELQKKSSSEKVKEEMPRGSGRGAEFGTMTTALFHRIEPGSFLMGSPGKQVSVKLTKAFEMTDTYTTQTLWREVLELAQMQFPEVFKLDPDPSEGKGGGHPINRVSHDDIQLWIEALNDLSAVGNEGLVKLIYGHKDGDTYRLPTEAEWEFVLKDRGRNTNPNIVENEEVSTYFWYRGNSGNAVQPVAQKMPLLVDGKAFYDMLGNVNILLGDRYAGALVSGTDPQGPSVGSEYVARGYSYAVDISMLDISNRNSIPSNMNFSNAISFRLVREVRP